jgi:hypothetical protein
MPSSGMFHQMALARTDVLEENIASIIRVERMSELGMLAVTSFLHSVLWLLVTVNVVPSSLILVTLKM